MTDRTRRRTLEPAERSDRGGPHRGLTGVTLGALGLFLLFGCGGEDEPEHRPNILLITVDTLRADRLGCYGYNPYPEPVSPHLDRLAEEGVVVEQCFAPRGQTIPSLSSMMTGRFPSAHGIRDNGQKLVPGQPTVASTLSKVGYDSTAIVSILPAYTPGREDDGPTKGFDRVVSAAHNVTKGKETKVPDMNDWDRFVARRGKEFLEKRDAEDGPFFLWLHFYSIHRPYAPPIEDHRRFIGDYDGALLPPEGAPIRERRKVDLFLMASSLNQQAPSPEDLAYVNSQYDAGVHAVDTMIGTVLDALRNSDFEDDTMVIFTADHGEELGDHQLYYFHGNSVYDGTLRIPMVVRWPAELEPRRVDELAQNVDFLPTILDLLGEDPSSIPDLEGVSLASTLREGSASARDVAYVEWQDMIYGVRTKDWKYLHNPFGAQPKKPPYNIKDHRGFVIGDEELYFVAEDPGEQHDLATDPAHDAKREELKAMALEFWDRPARIREWNDHIDEATLRQLQSLGYVGPLPGRGDVYIRGN